MSTCKSCGTRVLWVEFASGKKAPLDARPTPTGGVVLTAAVSGNGTPIARVLTRAEIAERGPDRRYDSHFTTCPNANDHRRRQ